MLPADTILGKFIRLPLGLLPRHLAVPVLRGPLRGTKWIVGSAYHGYWLGIYEATKQQRIAKELRPGDIFYDVGANVGLYSLMAARLVGPGAVYAFEPLPKNVSQLRLHLELNHIENVEVFELAVSDCVGSALFDEAENSSMGHLTQEGRARVRTATLDSLLLEERIAAPNCIKMDIEGAELMALRGAAQCIERHHPVIFLATHGRELRFHCCRLLETWGYECWSIGRGLSEDRDEIVARFRG